MPSTFLYIVQILRATAPNCSRSGGKKGDELAELRNTQGFRFVFDPVATKTATTAKRTDFRGTACYRVDEKLNDDQVRQVFFDIRTGLLVGRTNPKEATVVFGDWREVEGVKLPFARTEFHADTGEESRWRFEAVTFDEIDREAFSMPEDLTEEAEN